MPLCAKCQNPFVCHCSAAVRKPLGAVAESCPLDQRPGAIWVHVTDDRGVDVKDVSASNDGALKPTDANGVAVYDPVPVGEHQVRLSHRSVTALKLYEEPKKTTRKPVVAAGEISYVPYQIARKPMLKVKVVEKGNSAKLFEGATVTVTGAESPAPKPSVASGLADFEYVTAGDYKIKVELKAEDKKTHATTLDFATVTSDHNLPAGHDKEIVVEAEPLNVVTPKIELEYKIVLLDRKLHDKQTAADETKIYPGATRIEVSATQTNKAHPFTKTGKLVAPNVDVFTDEACTKPLTEDLKAEDLLGAKPKELWLRGKTAGLFDIKLTLEADPADRFVKLADEPATEKMGVVELKLELHEQDMTKLKGATMQVDPDTDPEDTYYTNLHAKVIPDQKLMSDDDKIGVVKKDDAEKPGRLLHVQNAGHFGRAKLVVAKIDAAQLPPGTDDYDIVLKVGRGVSYTKGADVVKSEELQGSGRDLPKSGSITLFDAETVGTKKENVSYKISALKAAAQTLWVEGTTETDQPCDVRLDVGMHRSAGGLAHTVKRNGDWTRFTVVKIDKIEMVDERKPGVAAPQVWDAAKKEYYINMKDDPDGRKLKFSVKLAKPLKNVTLHFMLAPDKNNKKAANWGKDMPAAPLAWAWKWKDVTEDVKHLDKTDRKDFLHLSEKTDAEGKAVKELTLSRFGGDKFQAAAYIDQDAHLAKYVEGHAELEKRKPVFMTDKIEVSRKFWHELIEVNGVVNPGVAASVTQYEAVKARMEAAPAIVLNPAPDGAVYPRYMIELNGGNANALVVSNRNKTKFFESVKKDVTKPIKVPILICDAQWDTAANTTAKSTAFAVPGGPIDLVTNRLILKPPLQGGNLVQGGTIEYKVKNGDGSFGPVQQHVLTDADVSVDPSRGDLKGIRVSIPGTVSGALAGKPGSELRVSGLVLAGAKGPYLGESFDSKVLAVYESSTALKRNDFFNTIVHEIGHGFGQALEDGNQPTGIPKLPTLYESIDSDGDSTGWHCNHATNKCVMYESGPIAGSLNRWCDICHPYLLVTDMSKYT